MMHRNSISLRWVAYEELVVKSGSESDDDEVKANQQSDSTETDKRKKTDEESCAENTEDDVSESAEFEDEGTMKKEINKSEKLSKYFLIFSMNIDLLQKEKKKKKSFSRLMSQVLRLKSTFGM